jgi:hypothetical protein
MRPIDSRQLRRLIDLTPVETLNVAIGQIPEGERMAYIDEHDEACSALRGALWAIGQMKCWYSEAHLQQGQGHVEHYRPKKRVAGVQHPGYWWRAFDWRNLRLAHPTVNLRKTDYLTGRKAGKGTYFPLRDENQRATDQLSESGEEPILLDPTAPADTFLICFSEESGAPRPRYSVERNVWLNARAAQSIEYYHLNEGTWNARRADLMAEVRQLCVQLESIAAAEPRDDDAYSEKINQIVSYIGTFAEFSSACLQVVRERGLLEHFATGLS